jgi:hypothetical protein
MPPEAARLEAKNHFYDVLMAGSGHSIVAGFLRELNSGVTMVQHISLSKPGRINETAAELDAIVDAF